MTRRAQGLRESAFVGQLGDASRVSANLHIVLCAVQGWLLVGLMSRPLPRAAELSIAANRTLASCAIDLMPSLSQPAAVLGSPLSLSVFPTMPVYAEPQFLRPGPRLGHQSRLILSQLLPLADAPASFMNYGKSAVGGKKPIFHASIIECV